MDRIIKINGMACGHCTQAVEKALKAIDGVSAVQVSLSEKCARVTGGDVETLRTAVEKAGFEVVDIA